MKDGKFETRAEIWRYLLDGKKIQYKDGEIVFLKDEILITIDNKEEKSGWDWSLNSPQHWSIYEEPKPKKKVTLYRYTLKTKNEESIYQTAWDSIKLKENKFTTILKTESKEIEVDDV